MSHMSVAFNSVSHPWTFLVWNKFTVIYIFISAKFNSHLGSNRYKCVLWAQAITFVISVELYPVKLVHNGRWTFFQSYFLFRQIQVVYGEKNSRVNDNVINSHFYTLGLAPITLMNEGTCQMNLLRCHFYDTLNVW